MSTIKIYKATIKQILKHVDKNKQEFQHLDIGSGSGELVKMLKKHINTATSCCDYTDELIQIPGQKIDIVDLNVDKKLPYNNDTFDIVTATEVIEHLEDFRAIMREIYRVLKPGGIFVLSTPNILSLNSRLRNLWFGFAQLMGPLPVENRKVELCAGHISPVSFFYVVHAMHEMNFRNIDLTVDKYQRSGSGKLLLFWLPIKVFGLLISIKEAWKYKTIDESNRHIVKHLNSLPILLGRTIIVSAIK